MSNGKEYTEGIAPRGKFLGWLDNFWYHYKWPTIIAAFFIVVALICTVQACSKESDDLTVIYAGRNSLSPAEIDKISAVLESVAPEDFDGNGEKSIAVSAYTIMSKEQIEELSKETDAAGNKTFADNSYFSSQYSTYNNYLKTGESSILFVEEWEYLSLLENGLIERLDVATGSTPEGAFSDYGIRLGDTDLYNSFGVMKLLPSDTVICLMKPLAVGKSHKEEYYAREKAMLSAILNYTSEEGESVTEG